MNLAELNKQVLDRLVGSDFKVTLPDGQTITVKLTQVSRVMERVPSSRLKREPFAVYFEAPDSFFLPQSMYAFTHAELGDEPLPIFIVPVARENGVFRYEAVFT
jgi:hypothetical protein